MIPFNKPCVVGNETSYISEAIQHHKLSGKGPFGDRCKSWLEEQLFCDQALLTPSCTHALEMAAILADIQEGDEVIMPSYTFVSTANAFVLRGARIKFVDIEPNTMNIDADLVKQAISDHTKAIVVVHYAGVACNMEAIMDVADKHGLFVIEDAAQALLSTYKGEPLGTYGHFATLSFHETKNYTCGEGGALLINDRRYVERAEILQEKGTNRSQFKRGQVDKYTWQDIGSSFLLSELNAAYLHAQFEAAKSILEDRMATWNRYKEKLAPLVEEGLIEIQQIPERCQHNAHMFYIKIAHEAERAHLMGYLNEENIMAVPHYEPLHSSVAGKQYGEFSGEDRWTTQEAERLLRLPLYYRIGKEDVDDVAQHIWDFFKK